MAKYSDHSTIGGQVLSHRIRMIKQNANIIFIAGKIAFVIGFLTYFFINHQKELLFDGGEIPVNDQVDLEIQDDREDFSGRV